MNEEKEYVKKMIVLALSAGMAMVANVAYSGKLLAGLGGKEEPSTIYLLAITLVIFAASICIALASSMGRFLPLAIVVLLLPVLVCMALVIFQPHYSTSQLLQNINLGVLISFSCYSVLALASLFEFGKSNRRSY